MPDTRAEFSQLSQADLVDAAVAALREAELLGVRLYHCRAQLAERSAEYERAVGLARAAEGKLARALMEMARVRMDLDRVSEELARTQFHSASLAQSLAEAAAARNEVLVELARVSEDLGRTQNHAAALTHSRAEVMAERDALLESLSWRVTKPLRAAKRLRR